MELDYEHLSLRLRKPFVTHRGRATHARAVLVRLSWDGRTGHGTGVIGDRPVDEALERCRAPLAEGTPFVLEPLLARLEAAVPDAPAVVAAVDIALHDLLGQLTHLPVHELFRLPAAPLPPTAVSLGALSAAEVVAEARERQGWPILKLKVTPGTDLSVVDCIRAVHGGRLWVDGNGAWTPSQAIAAAERLHGAGVELLEQPIRPGAAEDLRFVRERSPLPIVADEDCRDAADVRRLAGAADVVNIKLAKCGGLLRAREMVHVARACGLGVMLGCRTESVIGVTAMAQLAGLADHLDLDGHLDVLDEPWSGVAVSAGRVTLPSGPGLGVTAA